MYGYRATTLSKSKKCTVLKGNSYLGKLLELIDTHSLLVCTTADCIFTTLMRSNKSKTAIQVRTVVLLLLELVSKAY